MIDKFGNRWDEEKQTFRVDGSPEWAIEALDQSIKRLGGLYPDAYLLHRVDKQTPIEQTVRALDALRKEGKTKYIGLSEVGLTSSCSDCPLAAPGWRACLQMGRSRRTNTDCSGLDLSLRAWCS